MSNARFNLSALNGKNVRAKVCVDAEANNRVFVQAERMMSLTREEAITFATKIVEAVDQLEGGDGEE